MAFGTANGPIRFGELFLRVISAARTISIADGPPDPAIIPVRSCETCSSESPASAIASCIARADHCAASAMKRKLRLPMTSFARSFVSAGRPEIWLRKPSSAIFSSLVIPHLPALRLAATSSWLLPMQEMIPIPVITTRRIRRLLQSYFQG